MWFKLMMIFAGVACIVDRVVNGSESYFSGMMPVTENLIYIFLGVALIMFGVMMPRRAVRDMF